VPFVAKVAISFLNGSNYYKIFQHNANAFCFALEKTLLLENQEAFCYKPCALKNVSVLITSFGIQNGSS